MGTLKFTLTTPVVNLKWWNASRPELLMAVEKYNKQHWVEETDPVTSVKWAPRKPPTGSWPLLRKTGLMQDTTVFEARPTRPMVFQAQTVDYGPFLQYGTRYMPQRRWLGIGPDLAREMERIIAPNVWKKRKVTQRFIYKW